MIPASFDYIRANSVTEALEVLNSDQTHLHMIAGGHSLIPLLKLRLAQPSTLLDIGRISELDYIRDEGSEIAIGAMTRHFNVATHNLTLQHCPLVAETASLVGDPQVRHRGTIGGSVAHSDPASDIPTTLVACDAKLVLQGLHDKRVVDAKAFFTGFLDNDLRSGEILTEIRVPKFAENTYSRYVKFNRRAQDWAIVGVAVKVRVSGGQLMDAAIGLTNMGTSPIRASAAEAKLVGTDMSEASLREGASLVAEGTSPPSDTNGNADYRRHLSQVLTARALTEATLKAKS